VSNTTLPVTSLDTSTRTVDMETQQPVDAYTMETPTNFFRGDDQTMASSPYADTPKSVKVVPLVSSSIVNGADIPTDCDCGVHVSVAITYGIHAAVLIQVALPGGRGVWCLSVRGPLREMVSCLVRIS
jgi:hypothetical protein